MRIISGKFKGRKLETPKDLTIRPTLDRVKESIFNVLGPGMEGQGVLDLFSGTGSLGLEALSRGASHVCFVDRDPQAIELIRHNTKNLVKDAAQTGSFDIIQDDVHKYLRFCNEQKWDIIFLDPPYKIGEGVMKGIFDTIVARGLAAGDSMVVYEFFFKRQVGKETGAMETVKESFFGDKKVVYFRTAEIQE